jgi:hypothetical protein
VGIFTGGNASSDGAEVFSFRSLDSDEGASDAGVGVGDGPLFGVSCASFSILEVSSAQTTSWALGRSMV